MNYLASEIVHPFLVFKYMIFKNIRLCPLLIRRVAERKKRMHRMKYAKDAGKLMKIQY
jgi:hypothetical protein